jgi:hypothetical protein
VTTEQILAQLMADREKAVADGRYVDARHIDQEVIAHQQLARLRAQHAAYVDADQTEAAAQITTSIAFWRRQVTPDVDDMPAEPADTHGEPDTASDGPAPTPTRPRAQRRPQAAEASA